MAGTTAAAGASVAGALHALTIKAKTTSKYRDVLSKVMIFSLGIKTLTLYFRNQQLMVSCFKRIYLIFLFDLCVYVLAI